MEQCSVKVRPLQCDEHAQSESGMCSPLWPEVASERHRARPFHCQPSACLTGKADFPSPSLLCVYNFSQMVESFWQQENLPTIKIKADVPLQESDRILSHVSGLCRWGPDDTWPAGAGRKQGSHNACCVPLTGRAELGQSSQLLFF